MSQDLLTRRFRRDLPGPSDDARARMRSTVQQRLEGWPEPQRQGSRVVGALGVAGALAAGVAFFALALPRGVGPQRPSGAPGPRFAVLERGAPFDLAGTKLTTDKLSFPGVQAGSLRLSRTLSVGTKVVVGRASNDYVCLFLIPPRTRFREGTCARPRDVGVAALVQFAWWGKRQIVVLVANGVRLRTTNGRAVAVRNNTAVLDRDTTRLVAVTPDGVRRTLKLAANAPVPLRPRDSTALLPVVPDLTGLRPGDAATLLAAARLADGEAQTRAVTGIAPNIVIGQAIQPDSTASPHTEIDLVLAAPAGPNGERTLIPEDLPIRWAPASRRSGPAPFEAGTAGDLAGAVRVLLFPQTAAQAARAKWFNFWSFSQAIVVADADEGDARKLMGSMPFTGLIADADGSLARAAGVTRRPAVAVLDRSGRVAELMNGLPTRSGRGGPGDLSELLEVLQQEPFPPEVAPSAPRGVWYLQDRQPMPADQVPTFIRRSTTCQPHPDRVWHYGPTDDGWHAWAGLTTEGYTSTGPDLVLITSRGRTVGSRVSAASGCGVDDGYAARIRNQPVASLGTWGSGGRTTSLWLVRRGYTKATTPDGKEWTIANGLLAISQSGRSTPFTLTGPAGTRRFQGR